MDIEDICGCSKLPSIIPRKELPHLRSTSGECANCSNLGSCFYQYFIKRVVIEICLSTEHSKRSSFDLFVSIIAGSKFSPIFLKFDFRKVKIRRMRKIFIELLRPIFFFFFSFWHEVISLNLTWFLWKHHRCWLAPVSFFHAAIHTCVVTSDLSLN